MAEEEVKGLTEFEEVEDVKKGTRGGMGAINEINVTPMVDVMLVLLIIFMVITPMLSKGVSVDLVQTRNPVAMDEADAEDALVVAVTRDGQIFLGREKLDQVSDLSQEVSDRVSNRLDKTVYIKCDARSRYERVVEVVNAVRTSGVDQVGLLTEKEEERGSFGG
ncbi:MAG: biopolymer transporter ExbD [Bryobacterales bacterium]|nr:biopolymer transporter ExbD [Bryobacterales bacterium]MDE0627044.1 biopolymer transporter ExbD [Bryobacterales bacterium]